MAWTVRWSSYGQNTGSDRPVKVRLRKSGQKSRRRDGSRRFFSPHRNTNLLPAHRAKRARDFQDFAHAADAIIDEHHGCWGKEIRFFFQKVGRSVLRQTGRQKRWRCETTQKRNRDDGTHDTHPFSRQKPQCAVSVKVPRRVEMHADYFYSMPFTRSSQRIFGTERARGGWTSIHQWRSSCHVNCF